MGRTRRLLAAIMGGTDPLKAKITTWQNAQTSQVHTGGIEIASWLDSGSLNGADTTGRTFIDPSRAIRQPGFITSAKVKTRTRADANQTWSFRIYRQNGSNYDYVGGQDFTPLIDGEVNTITFSPPLAVQVGDIPGLYTSPGTGNTIFYTLTSARSPVGRFVNANVLTSDAFGSALGDTVHIPFEFYTTAPYLAVTGNSIMEGHNTAANSHGGLHTDSGTATQPLLVAAAEIAAQMRALIGGGTVLRYQNLALGSQTFAWVASTGIVQCHAVLPNSIIILCGVNDVNTARSWAQVEGNLDTIKAAITTEKLFISEILPWTAGDDTQAETIRTWNGNLATWCAANSATLLVCHDLMGKVRAATGEIDDLATAYDQDGLHLTTAGVARLAQIWKAYL